MNNKYFALVVTYTCGKCVFLTDTDDIQEALKQFRKAQSYEFNRPLGDKSFGLPTIVAAEITRVYYSSNEQQ